MLSRFFVSAWWLLVCVFCAVLFAAAAADDSVGTRVAVSRSKQVFTVEAASRVVAGRDEAWSVLTNYGGYVDFVPGMTLSRQVSDRPLLIEQHGEFGVLFFTKKVNATLKVTETPPSKIFFRSLDGNLRTLETTVDILVDGDQVVIKYDAVIEPDFWVPPLIGKPIVRVAIRKKLDAVANEIGWQAEFGAHQ
ncbi:MAG: hypothetical protein GTO41_06115 [Burkholderiales bacterium]|nr:hypothetical protein [Burkholderiales bacterium]